MLTKLCLSSATIKKPEKLPHQISTQRSAFCLTTRDPENFSKTINVIKQLMHRVGIAANRGAQVDLNSIGRAQRQWLLEQNKILNTLNHLVPLTRKNQN